MSAEPATNVVPFTPREYVADPVTGEVLGPADAQKLINSLSDRLEAATKGHADEYRRAENAQRKLDQKRKDDEEAASKRKDAGTIKTILEYHYRLTAKPGQEPSPVVFTGYDAELCRWLLGPAKVSREDICWASYFVARDPDFYGKNGITAFKQVGTTADKKGRYRDAEKCRELAAKGRALRERQAPKETQA